MACHTQQEIAEAVGVSLGEVNSVCSETATLPNLNKSDQAAAEHATNLDHPAACRAPRSVGITSHAE